MLPHPSTEDAEGWSSPTPGCMENLGCLGGGLEFAMPNTLFFQNVKKPFSGGGLPLFPYDRGVAFWNAGYVFASPIDAKATPYWEWHEGSSSTMLKRWVEERFGDTSPDESDYQPGTAYKRIYRPPIFGSFYRAIDLGKRSESFVALRILLHKLGGVFETIEPAIANQATYGHLVRELLLLACNEVESSWAAVLRENHYPARRNGWKTTDYIKLLGPMLLDTYRLSLRSYTDFPDFAPFESWDPSAPTKSLPWYDAYNKTKHDRESNLRDATLENAVYAVGAAVVMFFAQFGAEIEPRHGEQAALVIQSTFSLSTDFARHPRSCYVPEFTVPLTLNASPVPSFDWRLINYSF